MGKYPIDITDEENAKLFRPFKPTNEYDQVIHSPGGPTFLISGNFNDIPKENIARMVTVNEEIAVRQVAEEQGSGE